MEGFIGQVCMFGGNFAPKNWSFCNGNIISISSNTALFSILGTTYGGNGTTTFALPNAQGRVVIGAGNGRGLSSHPLGQQGGNSTTTLTAAQMPAHTHGVFAPSMVHCNENVGTNASPSNGFWGATANDAAAYGTGTDIVMAADAVTANITLGSTGSNMPFTTTQPYLGINYVICMYGIFPSRN